MKSIIRKVLLGLLVSIFMFSCGEKEIASKNIESDNTHTIAYIGYSSTNPFWNALASSAQESAKSLNVKFLDLTASTPEMAQQKMAIDNAIIKRVDGLVVGAVDSRGLGDSFDKAQKAGIPIVTVDTRVDHPAVVSHIATDNIAAARLAGEFIANKLNNKGKVLVLGGSTGSQTADDRQKGVEEILEQHEGVEVIFRVANWDAKQANEITNNILSSHDDLGAVFAACDPMIFTAMQAVKSKEMLGDVVLVGFDAIPAVLKAINQNEIDATVRQDPGRMGLEGVKLLVSHLNGEQTPAYIPISAEIVHHENIKEYISQ
ncbi:MAG: sugar ABC transporter substrate-binding protein [FCB group bacterium]|nr:sugar ABC transporter substrate-binding protein [FCB group bacterium]MBL7029014.1 sugar ABC transporter substrate-binding protein [Candidatus Neomarinimicrobiota bacterium]MBL7120425.1 sugar ABC transporter substrate-binding protein [Candidatus Neomarinimicrobiota bacterium]